MYIQKAIEIGQPTIKTGEPKLEEKNYGILHTNLSILRHSKRIAPFLSLKPLAKPTRNKINRHKDRLSGLQFRGFARGSAIGIREPVNSAPKKSSH